MKKLLSVLVACALLAGFAITASADAAFGTPKLGTNDPLWETAPEIKNNPDLTGATASSFSARVLWDADYLYVRVVVTDDDVFVGGTGDPWMSDNIEIFFGPGASGANQWRVNACGRLTGRDFADTWTSVEAPGYIIEVKIAASEAGGGGYTFKSGDKITFEIQSANSSSKGGDRAEATGLAVALGNSIPAWGTSDVDNGHNDSITLLGGEGATSAAAPAANDDCDDDDCDDDHDAPAPAAAASDAPAATAPVATAGNVAAAGGDDKGVDAGVASVAVIAGLAMLAAGGIVIGKKRK